MDNDSHNERTPLDARLEPAESGQHTWLSFEEIEAVGSDPWDFHRNDDRERAAVAILDAVEYDGVSPDPAELLSDLVPIYRQDLFDWAARPLNAPYLVDEYVAHTDSYDLTYVLSALCMNYWLDVVREAMEALRMRGMTHDDS